MKVVICTAATRTVRWFREDMIRDFVAAGCDVLVLGEAPAGEWGEYFDCLGVRYRSFFVERNGVSPFADLRTVRELKEILSEEMPDKVFVYHAKANIYGSIAARMAGVRDVYGMVGGLGSVFNTAGAKNAVLRAVMLAEYRIAFGCMRCVFFQNEDDRRALVSKGVLDSKKVVMVRGSGVNLERFAHEDLPQTFSFLFVGRLVQGKGVLDYLAAARLVKELHPEVEFDIVGPFDSNPTSLGPEDISPYVEDGTVSCHGEQLDVRPFLRACSAFVLPSYYGEGTPKSALEAMATGRPLIVADTPGCREVVRDGENGFRVPPRDPAAIAQAMLGLVEVPGLAERMGAASRRMAEEVFDVRKVNDVICETMGIGGR